MMHVVTGLERLIQDPPRRLWGKRLGLLCNPASVDSGFRHAKDLIHNCFPGQLAALYSPQHGFFAEKQDNMIESADMIDSQLNIPVFSLYGTTRIPSPEMLALIDVLLIDLQDTGTRVYTFTTTVSYCLEAAARSKIPVTVLDRPNPVGGLQVEGNLLRDDFSSFVGRYPIPMRHGLTMGEFAKFINESFDIGCELEVIPMAGWERKMYFNHTGLPWIPPSPNLPSVSSVMVYPGQVIWEGTNISEGRGTTLPFEMFGAPYLNLDEIASSFGGTRFPGGVLRPVIFEPIFHKYAGQSCRGFHLHITDPYRFSPYRTSLKMLKAVRDHPGDGFAWKSPPYEYEWDKNPFDLITGDDQIRIRLERGDSVESIEADWRPSLDAYIHASRKYYLYS